MIKQLNFSEFVKYIKTIPRLENSHYKTKSGVVRAKLNLNFKSRIDKLCRCEGEYCDFVLISNDEISSMNIHTRTENREGMEWCESWRMKYHGTYEIETGNPDDWV
jgi:hypothetical protein